MNIGSLLNDSSTPPGRPPVGTASTSTTDSESTRQDGRAQNDGEEYAHKYVADQAKNEGKSHETSRGGGTRPSPLANPRPQKRSKAKNSTWTQEDDQRLVSIEYFILNRLVIQL
jgi:hypothetical protein